MTSPIVDSIRTIPLVIQRGLPRDHIPMDVDETSGFPFERDSERDGHFRSQLDDIAKRHPELAEHLGNFSRRRQSSGGGEREPEDFHRHFERPFGSSFERFGFPFNSENFDPEQYAQQFYQQQPEFQNQPDHQQPQPQSYQQPNYQQQYSYPPQYQPQPQDYQQPQQNPPPQNPEEACTSETGRNNIQQSNTTDLGQKQEPVNERNQRSMSAPPTEKGQRFTSSINIPVNQPQPDDSENMAQTQSDGKTAERIIPIHIEGRDEPVLPKTAPHAYPQSHQTYSGPQPERIFGQRPEAFTQYVNREPRQQDKWHRPGFEQMHQGFVPEEMLRQQRFPQQNVPPHYQQQQQQQRSAPPPQQHAAPHAQPKEDIPIPVQRDGPQVKQNVPPQQTDAPPQPKPAPQQQKPKTPIDQIQAIQKDVSDLLRQVEQFAGKPKDKQYLYLDEMLTRNLLKLDDIDTQGQETIRSARKEAIKCIERTISVLEAKAAGNVEGPKSQENMEVEEKSQEPAESENKQTEAQTMETETGPEGSEPQPMEFSPVSTTNQETASSEEKKDEDKPAEENPQPVVENRAVLVTSEAPKEGEPMEAKEEPSAAAVEEPKPEASCEGQESNLAVAEAVKKFEGQETEKQEENKVQPDDPKVENSEEKKIEDKDEKKVEEKKEKKKGKKKVEKKEK